MSTLPSIELLKRAVHQLELEIANYAIVPSRLSHLVADINQYLNHRPAPVASTKVEFEDGSFEHVDQSGNFHREDGPALFQANTGTKCWYQHGRLHREGGPAVEYGNGDKLWLIHGLLHREDGPAIDWREVKSWYSRGELIKDPTK